MKTLITGSSGFIGRNLLSLFDNSDIYYLINKKNKCSNRKNLIFGNLQENETLEKIYLQKFDRVLHLAWEGLPLRNKEKNELNEVLSRNLIDSLISSNKNCELNFTGSCFEYGNIIGCVNENQSPSEISDFGKTKLNLLNYVKSKTDNFRWFRPFFVYGPNQHQGSIINYISSQVKEEKEIALREPDSSFDYIYVGDVAFLMWSAIQVQEMKGIINIGSGKLTSNLEIVQLVKKFYKKENFEDSNFDKRKKKGLFSDNSKINEFFPHFKFTNITEGIKKTLKERSIDR